MVASIAWVAAFAFQGTIGIDARIYSEAARAWIAGGDPWSVAVDGHLFAAPPPTLIPFALFAVAGQQLSAAVWVCGSGITALAIVRQLKLPWWWLLFPPLVNGILAGNPDVLIVWLLLQRRSFLGVLATFLKIYALVPIVGEHRLRTAAITAVAIVGTSVLVPWHSYISRISQIAATLDAQAIGSSAYGTPWLMGLVCISLAALGTRRAGWMAVPALWPSTQLHYAALALPAITGVRNPFLLLLASLFIGTEAQWFAAFATLIVGGDAFVTRLRESRRHAATSTLTPGV
jgi:hypothetical protein